MNLEKLIIEHASPTLAKIKTANLINVTFKNLNLFIDQIFNIKNILKNKNIELEILRLKSNSALVYVYRLDLLTIDLSNNVSIEILSKLGYNISSVQELLYTLSDKLKNSNEFPHEIGLFLGYPSDDVKEFIDKKGKDCFCCGYWKVYNNVTDALCTFRKYDICRKLYIRHFNMNKDLSQLII